MRYRVTYINAAGVTVVETMEESKIFMLEQTGNRIISKYPAW